MKSKTFAFRYLLSYFIVIILPVAGLVTYLYRTSIRSAEEKFSVEQSNKTLQVRNMVETEIQRVPQIRSIISLDSCFSPIELEKSNFANYTAIQRLKEFTLYSNVIRSVVIYSEKLPYLLTEAGSVTKKYFGDMLYSFQEYDQETLFQRLKSLHSTEITRESLLIPNEVNDKYLVYWYPIRNYSSEYSTVLMIFVDIRSFEDMISNIHMDDAGCFAILNDQRNCIVSTREMSISAQEVLGIYEKGYVAGEPVKIKDKLYFVTRVSGDHSGWVYLYYTPYDQIASETRLLRHRLISLILIILCISGIMLYIFLKINYTPLKKLEAKVRQELCLGEQKDEIKTIQDGFRVLKEKTDQVNECISQSRPALIRHGLEQLLEGSMPGGIYSGTIKPPQKNWIVATTLALNEEQLNILRKSINMQDTSCYYYLLANQGTTILLINTTEEKMQEAAKKLESIFMENGMAEQLCISSVAEGVEQIPARYDEVRARMLQIPLAGRSKQGDTDQVIEGKKVEVFLRDLESVVQIGDVSHLSKLRLQISKFDFHELTLGRSLNCLLSLWQASINNGLSSELQKNFQESIGNLTRRPTAKYFQMMLNELILKTEKDLYHEKNIEGGATAAERYKKYLEEHYLDDDFSMTQMAEKMGISASHMSNVFKSAQGITMIEYVNWLKMQRAMELIRTQNISVSELSRKLRYQSTSSFIRAFKKITYMTPRQYADQISERENKDGMTKKA